MILVGDLIVSIWFDATLILNYIAQRAVKKYREKYDYQIKIKLTA